MCYKRNGLEGRFFVGFFHQLRKSLTIEKNYSKVGLLTIQNVLAINEMSLKLVVWLVSFIMM